ncbi:MAG TPA: DUF1810 domain-containing protein [Steroidobacteraceae bacterium]|nr:DUF1810 domain-containing protein [Steroidobacteraceae bacterium]
MDDPYDLGRFVLAQEPVFERVCAELAAGSKHSHWMWFVFPQLRGLGSSATAQRFAIGSLEEARAYLAHRLLGERLRECTRLVNGVEGRSARAIFGYPDYLKFRSCMTLFAYAARSAAGTRGAPAAHDTPAATDGSPVPDTGADAPFSAALEKYFAGEADRLTRELLELRAC